jgi:hypothetical protein
VDKVASSFKALFTGTPLQAKTGLAESQQAVSNTSGPSSMGGSVGPGSEELPIPIISTTLKAFLPPLERGDYGPIIFKYKKGEGEEIEIPEFSVKLPRSQSSGVVDVQAPQTLDIYSAKSSLSVKVSLTHLYALLKPVLV